MGTRKSFLGEICDILSNINDDGPLWNMFSASLWVSDVSLRCFLYSRCRTASQPQLNTLCTARYQSLRERALATSHLRQSRGIIHSESGSASIDYLSSHLA